MIQNYIKYPFSLCFTSNNDKWVTILDIKHLQQQYIGLDNFSQWTVGSHHLKTVVNFNVDLNIIWGVLTEVSILVNTLLTIPVQTFIANTLEPIFLAVPAFCPWVTSGDVETVTQLVVTRLDIFC